MSKNFMWSVYMYWVAANCRDALEDASLLVPYNEWRWRSDDGETRWLLFVLMLYAQVAFNGSADLFPGLLLVAARPKEEQKDQCNMNVAGEYWNSVNLQLLLLLEKKSCTGGIKSQLK